MLINFKQQLLTVYGKPFEKAENETEVTLGNVAVQALLGEKQADTSDAKSKIGRWALAQQIAQADGPIDITTAQAAEIQERIAAFYGAAIVGPAHTAIESASKH